MPYEINWNPNVPGETDGLQYTDKQILLVADYHEWDRIAVTIAPGTGDLDKGTVLGVGTADGLFRPVRRYALNAAAVSGVTAVQVAGTPNINVGDTVSVMKADGTGVENGGAVTAVTANGGNTTITFTTATAEALVVGDYVYVSDGSQKAVAVLGDVVWDASSNKIANAYLGGKFVQSRLVGVDAIVVSDLHARSIPYTIDATADNILVV